jgi:internalin A
LAAKLRKIIACSSLCVTLLCGYTCASKDKTLKDKTIQKTNGIENKTHSDWKAKEINSDDTYWDVKDLTYFLNNPFITVLKIQSGSFSNLTPLANLTQLEELEILNNVCISSIEPLAKLQNLKKLNLSGCKNIVGIQPLANLFNLNELDISSYDHETICAELAHLKALKVLWISIGKITSLTHISQLDSLEEIVLDVSYIHDDSIATLQNLKNLKNLELYGVRYIDIVTDYNRKKIYLEWIKQLSKLEYLRLEGFEISDVQPLLDIPCITTINLDRCVVGDLIPLVNSKSIKNIVTPIGYDRYGKDKEINELFLINGISVGRTGEDH